MQGHAFKENIGTRTNINNRGGGGGSRCLVYMCLLSLDFPAEQCSNPKHHICMFVRPHLWRTEMRKLGALAMPLVRSFSTPPPPPTRRPPDNFIIDSKANCRSLTHLFFWIFCMLCSYCLHLFAFPSLTLRQTRDLRGILQPEQNHSRAPASKARR